jgi:hypothetical protein
VYWVIVIATGALLGWHALTVFDVKMTSKPRLWQQRFVKLRRRSDWLGNALAADGALLELSVRAELHQHNVGWWDVLGALVAFFGVTGYLPYTVIGAINAHFNAGQRLAEIAFSVSVK